MTYHECPTPDRGRRGKRRATGRPMPIPWSQTEPNGGLGKGMPQIEAYVECPLRSRRPGGLSARSYRKCPTPSGS